MYVCILGTLHPAPGSKASRYSRYEPDRRSRSPRDRSPDRFDSDRRRPSTDVRSNASAFQSNRDSSFDGPRREPPRGPRALIDPSRGYRSERGRGRGRGGWARDDSRDRGRDRDLDFRDRYRDDRSRERDRDRDRDRDWDRRDSYRARRSPPRPMRSPTRDFHRDRDNTLGPDPDRSRRDSRDGSLTGVSPSLDGHFAMPSARSGPYGRGRGRGGRGDWVSDRGRGRVPFDDRGDRYPRSRSQDGRWGRDRDDRDRGDRYPDTESRRDLRDDRERVGHRELFRNKMEPRPNPAHDPVSQKEVSPPPVAPSAPAFGSVPNRADVPSGSTAMNKAPPTAPRAFGERQMQSQEPPNAPMGPAKSMMADTLSAPSGPRAQHAKAQRPSSKQWINPNIRKTPDSPKMMRAQSFAQSRPGMPRHDTTPMEYPSNEKRPQSSDSKSGSDHMDLDSRRRSHHSAEPGEIMPKMEEELQLKSESSGRRLYAPQFDRSGMGISQERSSLLSPDGPKTSTGFPARTRKHPFVKAIRFAVPPKPEPPADQASESDDDEDMDGFFDMEIEKNQVELDKLHKPKLPLEVVARFASMSHGAMIKILNEGEGLVDILGEIPKDLAISGAHAHEPPASAIDEEKPAVGHPQQPESPQEAPKGGTDNLTTEEAGSKLANLQLKPEAMDIDRVPAPIAPASAAGPGMDVDANRAEDLAKSSPKFSSTEKRSGELPIAEQILPSSHPAVPVETTEIASKPPSTPSQVEDEGDEDETESDEEAYVDVEVVRQYAATPPLDTLPTLNAQPWDKDPDLLTSLDSDPALDDYILDHLRSVHIDKTAEQKHEQQIYAEKYAAYLKFTMSDDPVASKSRDKFNVSGPPLDPVGPATPEPRAEGRSGRRFASERDLERVLQASMREEDERRERESRMQKEKYRGDKEAVIPDMLWNADEKESEQFIDRSGFVPTSRLVSAWQVLPPVNNFTKEEADLFEKRYLELPKQWGKVAEVIPNRDFGTCIQYYYLMKKDLNLKEKLRRQPKRRKKGGRGKQRSSALVSELGNGDPEGEDNNDNGENGESRRRPRRAAAPTWGFEQPPTESENGTPVSTPGRRGASTAVKGDQPDKADGRKGRRKAAKDKEAKIVKPNQALAAAPAAAASRSRSRGENKNHNLEFQADMPREAHRLPTHFEQQQYQPPPPPPPPPPSGNQPAFSIDQPQQQQPPLQNLERSQPLAPAASIADVMAPPSLRPEPPPPPPQPAMSTFNLAQTQPERKAQPQASSYWSVSESNDFPLLLRAFGSDWTSIASHMGSKTAVMVKNYYVRQKDSGKTEWEDIMREADAKRQRGEKRPDPPQPSTGGRGRRYDSSATNSSRPLAAAPGAMELGPEPSYSKLDGVAQQQRSQGYPGYGIPIAQAPVQQQQQQPPPPPQGVQKSLSLQPQPQPQPQPQQTQPVAQSIASAPPSLRAPLQPFGFPDRDREQAQQGQPRVPLPQKAGPPHADMPRHMTSVQSLHPAHAEASLEQRQKMDMLHQQQAEREREGEREYERKRERERERDREEREREMARQAERQAMRPKPEPEMVSQKQYEPYGHRPPSYVSRSDTPRGDPLSLSRHPQEPPRHGPPQTYHAPPPPPTSSQQVRSLLSDGPPAHSPPPLGPPTSRPVSALQQRPSSGSVSDSYRVPTPQPSAQPPVPAANRPPEQPRKSNIMSLLNDDGPSPPPKRVNEVAEAPVGASSTPPPQGMGRAPPVQQQQPSHLRRDSESQYSPFGRPPSAAASVMPPLKPTYNASPGGSRSSLGMPVDSPTPERDYYRPTPYQAPGSQSAHANSPPATHRYPTPTQTSQAQYQAQAGYPTPFGSASQPPHGSSPPPQFSLHSAGPRSRDTPQSSRDPWPTQGHHQTHGGWVSQAPKTNQPPTAGQTWTGQHGVGTTKSGTPTSAWPSAPPPQQPHPSLRDDRGGHAMYSPHQQQPPPPHQMQGRYAPPASRGPDPVPPPAQAYPRYASTPGPGPPRDLRDVPARSYTPVGYDNRVPPPPSAPGYPVADPRDMQLRDGRDPREMIARGLRPQDYDRHSDPYGR